MQLKEAEIRQLQLEMQVLTGNYAAEYGRADGGQIRIVTKGGGSQFHGGAYEYFRNSDMNANTWSRNQSTRPPSEPEPPPSGPALPRYAAPLPAPSGDHRLHCSGTTFGQPSHTR